MPLHHPWFTRRLPLAVAVAALAAPTTAVAQAPVPGPSFEQVVSLRAAGSVAISPDGRDVAFTVRSTDWKENRFDSEIWLARAGEEPFQLTRTERGSSGPVRWSPDGRWLAFVASRDGKPQVWLLRSGGGEARPVTAHAEGVGSFAWSPDGRSIAFTAQDAEDRAARERRERLGEFAVEDAEYRQSHLWVVEVRPDRWLLPTEAHCAARPPQDTTRSDDSRGGASTVCGDTPRATRLTEGRGFTVTGFAWSPDGAQIAFAQQRDPLITSGSTADISVVEVASRNVRPLVTTPGSDYGPIWSPDGRWIVYSSTAGDTTTNFYANSAHFRVPSAGGEPVRIATDLDENIGLVAWTPTGLYGVAWQGAAARRLVRVDPVTGRVRALADGPQYVLGADISPDGRSVALTAQTPTTLAEVYRSPLAALRPVALTRFTEQIRDWPVGTAELVRWKSADGTEIEGVLHKPAGFDPSRKYPLLVVIHGGPTGIDFPVPVTGYVYPVPQWLARGALVLRPNYRGSAGYGARFRALNVRNLGVGDAWDVLSGVDHLVRQGVVDTTRMGAMGWSQGGYISAFLTTTTDRFRAVSVGAGISDWMTYYVNTDIHPFTRQYLRATPWDDPEIYRKTSPISYIKQARTPTLIQHGEFDRRVPIANAYQLYQGLQDQGVPTELIVYKGFGHGIDKPREQLAALWHNWRWFGRYVWGDAVQTPVGMER